MGILIVLLSSFFLSFHNVVVFTFGDAFRGWLQLQSKKSTPESVPIFNLALAQLALAIYGGFFGAGLGILMLATLSFLGIKNIHTINAFKAFLGSCINGIAIIPFIFAGVIIWQQAILMAVGGSLGGYLSAHYARRVKPQLIRKFVIFVAFTMTIYFFIRG
ncbi:sulfite exporter TauE/SafE family protein [Nostoc sp. T09]|uniref:sulfite exporter TauE/SafE family protein n=1 Tax=Nostoc sp. T09 TaxID=1932621 RepID=UPI00211B6D77|nr:sulfite exporter TauE/SafE family protein [Nostoc sp. T09]